MNSSQIRWASAFWRFLRLVANPWAKVYTAVSAVIGLVSLLGVAALATLLPNLEPYRWQFVAASLLLFVFVAGLRLQIEKDEAGALPRLAVAGQKSGQRYALIDVTNTRSTVRTFTAQLLKAGDSARKRSLSWDFGSARPETVEIQPQITRQLTIGQVSEKARPPGQRSRLRVMRPRGSGSDYYLDMPGGEIDVTVRISANDGEVTDVNLIVQLTPTGVETVVTERSSPP